MPDNTVPVKVDLSPNVLAYLTNLRAEFAAAQTTNVALRDALRTLIDESERVILAEEQATGRALASLQWAVDRAHTALANNS